MIKLRKILNEHFSNQRPDPSLDAFLKENKVHKFTGYLYHGSPMEGLKGMLTSKIWGQEHGEIAEYSTFSTSANSEILHFFSEGEGETGLSFHVKDANILVLDDIIHFLAGQLSGAGTTSDVDEEELKQFCERYKVAHNKGWGIANYFLPYDYISSLGVDGFVFDYTWQRLRKGMVQMPRNDESEICFVGDGIDRLNNEIFSIWVDGQEFEPTQKAEAIKAIDEYVDTNV